MSWAKSRSSLPASLRSLVRAGRTRGGVDAPDGRRRERHKLIALAALSSLAARGINVISVLITIPLTLSYLGAERFGIWATLSSLALVLSFTDFGIGNSVVTAVAHHSGSDDNAELVRQISGAYLVLGVVTAALLLLLALTGPMVDWAAILAARSPLAVREAGPAAMTFLALTALAIPLTLIYRVLTGLQLGWQANIWQAAGNLATLAAVVAATQLEAGLQSLVLAFAGTPLIFGLICTLHILLRRRPDLLPRWRTIDGQSLRWLTSSGFLFLVLQICAVVGFQTNSLVIAQILGPEAVAEYAVVDRMFAITGMFLLILLAPLWPAYGEAAARGDREWLRRTFWRSFYLSIGLSAFLSLILVVAGQQLLRWWVGPAIGAPLALLAAFALWRVLEAGGTAAAMLLNGTNHMTVQVLAAVLFASASIVLRIFWTEELGTTGTVLGIVVAYLVFTVPVVGFAVRKVLRTAGAEP
jgi:O-antigen/teichoic acid export membrane protein